MMAGWHVFFFVAARAALMIINDVHGPNGDYRVGVRWNGDITLNTTFSFEARRSITVQHRQTLVTDTFFFFFNMLVVGSAVGKTNASHTSDFHVQSAVVAHGYEPDHVDTDGRLRPSNPFVGARIHSYIGYSIDG